MSAVSNPSSRPWTASASVPRPPTITESSSKLNRITRYTHKSTQSQRSSPQIASQKPSRPRTSPSQPGSHPERPISIISGFFRPSILEPLLLSGFLHTSERICLITQLSRAIAASLPKRLHRYARRSISLSWSSVASLSNSIRSQLTNVTLQVDSTEIRPFLNRILTTNSSGNIDAKRQFHMDLAQLEIVLDNSQTGILTELADIILTQSTLSRVILCLQGYSYQDETVKFVSLLDAKYSLSHVHRRHSHSPLQITCFYPPSSSGASQSIFHKSDPSSIQWNIVPSSLAFIYPSLVWSFSPSRASSFPPYTSPSKQLPMICQRINEFRRHLENSSKRSSMLDTLLSSHFRSPILDRLTNMLHWSLTATWIKLGDGLNAMGKAQQREFTIDLIIILGIMAGSDCGEHRKAVQSVGGVRLLCRALSSPDPIIRQHTLLALSGAVAHLTVSDSLGSMNPSSNAALKDPTPSPLLLNEPAHEWIFSCIEPLLLDPINRQLYYSATQTHCLRLCISQFQTVQSITFGARIFDILFNLLARVGEWNLVLSLVEAIESVLLQAAKSIVAHPPQGFAWSAAATSHPTRSIILDGFDRAGGVTRLRACLESARSIAVSLATTSSSGLSEGISSWIELKIRSLEDSLLACQ